MKLFTLTKVSTLEHPGFIKLKESLDYFKYDYRVIHEPLSSQSGNGHQQISRWLKQNREDYTHFLFTDGFDTIALAPMEEAIKHYKDHDYWLYSAEKACYPIAEWAELYPPCETPWRFINGGQFIAPIDLYMEIVDNAVRKGENDQEWAHANMLFRGMKIKVESAHNIFQSVAFEDSDDFLYEHGRLYNRKTKTYPVLAHLNGHTDGTKLYAIDYKNQSRIIEPVEADDKWNVS